MRRRCGISRATSLVLLFISFSHTLATAAATSEGDSLAEVSPESLSDSEVLTAYRAWNKLRDEMKPGTSHGAHRREAVDVIGEKNIKVAVTADEGVGERHLLGGAAGNKAQKERAPSLLTEYTVDAESSFTAVSRALDALANQTRLRNETGKGSAERSAIATNVFVIEGNIDTDTVRSYLNSKQASDALARSEANALRKVMTLLLQPDSAKDSGGSVIHTRIGRSVANPPAKDGPIKHSVRRLASPNHLVGHRQRHDPGKMNNRINTKWSRFAPKSTLRRKSNVRPRERRRVRKVRPGGAEDDDDDDDDEDEEEETPKFLGRYRPNKGSFYRKQPTNEEEEEEDDAKGKPSAPSNSTADEESLSAARRRTNQHWRNIDSFAARSGLRYAYEDPQKRTREYARYIGYGVEEDPHGFARKSHASDTGNNTSSVDDDS